MLSHSVRAHVGAHTQESAGSDGTPAEHRRLPADPGRAGGQQGGAVPA